MLTTDVTLNIFEFMTWINADQICHADTYFLFDIHIWSSI